MAIDLTDRYHTPEFQAEFSHSGRRIDWTIDRDEEPVRALMIHHTTGFYLGVELDEHSTQEEEVAELDEMARDHRERFGIGPGYYYAGFPSRRLYAIGKYGTHRAHVKGVNPETQNLWNRESLAIVAFGNFQTSPVSPGIRGAIQLGIHEVRQIVGDDVALYGHREVPGNPTQTSCPGDRLMPFVEAWRALGPPPTPTEQAIQEVKEARAHLGKALELWEAD